MSHYNTQDCTDRLRINLNLKMYKICLREYMHVYIHVGAVDKTTDFAGAEFESLNLQFIGQPTVHPELQSPDLIHRPWREQRATLLQCPGTSE